MKVGATRRKERKKRSKQKEEGEHEGADIQERRGGDKVPQLSLAVNIG